VGEQRTVGELGEFALIDAIRQRLAAPNPDAVPIGIGDDAAVLAPRGRIVATTDMLVQGNHFRLDWSGPGDIGHKAAAQNLADVCAMGATPVALLVALCLPASTEVDWVLELADGMSREAARVGAAVVGGDIVRGRTVSLSVTALGDLGDRVPITRSGAGPNQVVAYTGRLGISAAGLMLLQRGFRSPRALVNAHRAPEPDYAGALAASEACALIDTSDGLVSDLGHIARASGVSIHINTSQLVVDEELAGAASAFNTDVLPWLLHGGEDHAFVGVFPNALAVPAEWTIIGGTQAGPPEVFVNGLPTEGRGWDHFGADQAD
jgi:thiamine-monophosphate kinase